MSSDSFSGQEVFEIRTNITAYNKISVNVPCGLASEDLRLGMQLRDRVLA